MFKTMLSFSLQLTVETSPAIKCPTQSFVLCLAESGNYNRHMHTTHRQSCTTKYQKKLCQVLKSTSRFYPCITKSCCYVSLSNYYIPFPSQSCTSPISLNSAASWCMCSNSRPRHSPSNTRSPTPMKDLYS